MLLNDMMNSNKSRTVAYRTGGSDILCDIGGQTERDASDSSPTEAVLITANSRLTKACLSFFG